LNASPGPTLGHDTWMPTNTRWIYSTLSFTKGTRVRGTSIFRSSSAIRASSGFHKADDVKRRERPTVPSQASTPQYRSKINVILPDWEYLAASPCVFWFCWCDSRESTIITNEEAKVFPLRRMFCPRSPSHPSVFPLRIFCPRSPSYPFPLPSLCTMILWLYPSTVLTFRAAWNYYFYCLIYHYITYSSHSFEVHTSAIRKRESLFAISLKAKHTNYMFIIFLCYMYGFVQVSSKHVRSSCAKEQH
jgi:hypothetical protein